MARTRRRTVLRVLGVLVLLVGTVVLVLASLQRQLIYFPDRSDPGSVTALVPGGQDVVLTTEDDLQLAAWLVPPAEGVTDTGYAVLLAPGNGGHRLGRLGLAQGLAERGLTVLLLDYRGYGGNPGSPSQDGLARDADAAVRALGERGVPLERVVYLGESIGTGVVAELTERHRPAAVVLRSPYTTFADVAGTHYRWLPVRALLRDNFDVVGPLSRVDVPVTVILGTADGIVPTELSRRVAQEVAVLAEEVVLEGVGHNDEEMFGAPVADAVARAVASVEAGPGEDAGSGEDGGSTG